MYLLVAVMGPFQLELTQRLVLGDSFRNLAAPQALHICVNTEAEISATTSANHAGHPPNDKAIVRMGEKKR